MASAFAGFTPRGVATLAATAALAGSLAVACSKSDATAPYQPPAECASPGVQAGGARAVVAIRGFAYTPDTLRVARGTAVTWVNCEQPTIDPHTATGGAWDSGYLKPGASYTRVFDAVGLFGYSCLPHPFMKGGVVVQ